MQNPLAARVKTRRVKSLIPFVTIFGMVAIATGAFVASMSTLLGAMDTDASLTGWMRLLLISGPVVVTIVCGVLLLRIFRWYMKNMHSHLTEQFDSERVALMELASHQLGAPLATFRWWLEMLEDSGDASSYDPKLVVAQIGDAVKRMESIVEALNGASNVQAGTVAYHSEIVSTLKHVVEKVVHDSEPLLTRQKQRIDVSLEDGMRPVQIDTKLLFGVLQELAYNAITYSPPESVIEIRVQSEGNHARIEVADHGYGIPAKDLPRMMQKFSRASNAAQHKPVGNGLGLYITRGIIEKAGGEMRIKSKEGKGTTVSFTLPFASESK